MLTCDICKKEITSRRDLLKPARLPYEYSCSAWQSKDFDMCHSCEKELHNILTVAKANFMNSKRDED